MSVATRSIAEGAACQYRCAKSNGSHGSAGGNARLTIATVPLSVRVEFTTRRKIA